MKYLNSPYMKDFYNVLLETCSHIDHTLPYLIYPLDQAFANARIWDKDSHSSRSQSI